VLQRRRRDSTRKASCIRGVDIDHRWARVSDLMLIGSCGGHVARKAVRFCWLLLLVVAVHPECGNASAVDVIRTVFPKTVKIFGAGGLRNLPAYGSGFLVSPDGHVVTIWSHVLDQDRVTVVLDDGRRFKADVIGAEPQLEVAVLKLNVQGESFPCIDIASASDVPAGTRVFAFSNMYGVATGDESLSVLRGVVAGRMPLTTDRGAYSVPWDGEMYIIDAVTNNVGASGGIITTRDGSPLAMIGRVLRDERSGTWINYAIPLSALRPVVDGLIAGDYTAEPPVRDDSDQPPRYTPEDFGFVLVPDVVRRTPAWVVDVINDSPADRAGIEPDDLVLLVNDEYVRSCRELRARIGKLEPGELCGLVLRRGDQLVSVELVAGGSREP